MTSIHRGKAGTAVGKLAVPPNTDWPNLALPKMDKACASESAEKNVAARIKAS